ncbi:hypothetical protein R3I94_004957 [Phoxinus phoxinus]
MDELLSIIGPELTRQSTNYRVAIEPKQRLAVGLRYLASGDSMVSLAFNYRLGHAMAPPWPTPGHPTGQYKF